MTGPRPVDAPGTWGGRPVARTVRDAGPRQRAVLEVFVHAVHSRRSPTLRFEVDVSDETGRTTLRFLGRDKVPGIRPGAQLLVEGTMLAQQGRLVILNPRYELLAGGR